MTLDLAILNAVVHTLDEHGSTCETVLRDVIERMGKGGQLFCSYPN